MKGSNNKNVLGLTPSEWEDLFRRAGVQTESLDAAKSHRARSTILGSFLSQHLDRVVPIEVNGRQGMARLRAVDAGKRQRRYFFEIVWDHKDPPVDPPDRDPGHEPRVTDRNKPPAAPGRRQRPTARNAKPAKSPAKPMIPTPSGRNGKGNDEEWS